MLDAVLIPRLYLRSNAPVASDPTSCSLRKCRAATTIFTLLGSVFFVADLTKQLLGR